MFSISVGIMAYNEESNISRLLMCLLNQEMSCGHITEIFVVASGCTDRTEDIVRTFEKEDSRIRLLVQPRREGKASAINLFLSKASGDIIILESADTIPENAALDTLSAAFLDPTIGMAGARPIPVNSNNTFVGFTVNLMWSLHHQIALITPKLGELIAFRSFVRQIPGRTAVDEASIESIVKNKGYSLCYVPSAIVRNKGPETIKDFILQRRRIAAGHKHLLDQKGYEVSTLNPKRILAILINRHSWNLKETVWTLGAIVLEVVGRLLGYYDYSLRKHNPVIWPMASSTKRLDDSLT